MAVEQVSSLRGRWV